MNPPAEGERDDAAMLKQFLAGRDRACPQCEYNLRDLLGTRCPECGEELALRLQLSEPKQAAPLAGLVLLSAGAGLNGLLLIYAAIEIVNGRGPRNWWNPFIAVNVCELVVIGTCLAAWLALWRRIRRLGVMRRWALVVACGMLALADIIFFSKLIR